MTLPFSAAQMNAKSHWLVIRLHDRRMRSNIQTRHSCEVVGFDRIDQDPVSASGIVFRSRQNEADLIHRQS
jgi:hypothetical protein